MHDIREFQYKPVYSEVFRAVAVVDSTSASVELHLLVRAACSRHRLMATRIRYYMHVYWVAYQDVGTVSGMEVQEDSRALAFVASAEGETAQPCSTLRIGSELKQLL